MSLIAVEPQERVDTWRQRVPSRVERQDPFQGDGFDERPPTRLTFRDTASPVRRPSTRMSFLRSVTPLFGRPSTSSSRAPSSMTDRPVEGKRKSVLGLLSRKRKRRESSVEVEIVPREPVRLNFLFVGSKAAGQTSLLFRARYGYFPDDTSGVPDLNTVENLTYIAWDAVFLCFDISDKVSMYTIMQWWHHAFDNGFTHSDTSSPLLYLVGLKKDLRDQCFLEDHRAGAAHAPSGLFAYSTCCICSSEASWHAERLGAHRYLECSAATGQGMEEVLEDSAREALGRVVGTELQEEELVVPKKRRRFF
ncbi:hypothetical protein FZEAL_302 [Fusarium zealandicum]|uniref:Uncharacterized protein n=1 Tax=Fusarium zealandicum TaxID=1053134 RepID=A0A8H4UVP4_9HYPO|nr:hypothetical protein FZEAL_302 [Fusarium zealandicum]